MRRESKPPNLRGLPVVFHRERRRKGLELALQRGRGASLCLR